MNKRKPHNLVPPGVSLRTQLLICGGVLLLVVCTALTLFHWDLTIAKQGWITYQAINGQAPDFVVLLRDFYACFWAMPITAALVAVYNYQWFRTKGANSLYLMRRLPDRWELARRVLGIPVLALAATLLVMLLAAPGCLAAYYRVLPASCIPPDQWEKLLAGLPSLFNPFYLLIGGI